MTDAEPGIEAGAPAAEPVVGPALDVREEPALGPAAEALEASRPARAPAGELLSAVSALALLVLMFAAKWYGVVALPRSADRSGIESAVSAWSQLTVTRWVMLLTVLITLGSVVLHITQRSHGSQTDTSRVVLVAGALTALLMFDRVLVALPAPRSIVDAKLGAFLGLIAAFGIALGGLESVIDQRRRRRRLAQRARRPRPLASDPGPR